VVSSGNVSMGGARPHLRGQAATPLRGLNMVSHSWDSMEASW